MIPPISNLIYYPFHHGTTPTVGVNVPPRVLGVRYRSFELYDRVYRTRGAAAAPWSRLRLAKPHLQYRCQLVSWRRPGGKQLVYFFERSRCAFDPFELRLSIRRRNYAQSTFGESVRDYSLSDATYAGHYASQCPLVGVVTFHFGVPFQTAETVPPSQNNHPPICDMHMNKDGAGGWSSGLKGTGSKTPSPPSLHTRGTRSFRHVGSCTKRMQSRSQHRICLGRPYIIRAGRRSGGCHNVIRAHLYRREFRFLPVLSIEAIP